MSIPDYISPIVGYRVWQWDAVGLKSLNNEPWLPGRALEAACKPSDLAAVLAKPRNQHDPPYERCTCGIYAAKKLWHLPCIGYPPLFEVHGEVYLWGKIWDHRLGYRAEYAYPKNIVLPQDMVPCNMCEVESRLKSLIPYGVDIFIAAPPPDIAMIPVVIPQDIPLWTKASGYNQAGFDWLTARRKWLRRHKTSTELTTESRVHLVDDFNPHPLSLGCPVDSVTNDEVRLRVWKKRLLILPRCAVTWNPEKSRWESQRRKGKLITVMDKEDLPITE